MTTHAPVGRKALPLVLSLSIILGSCKQDLLHPPDKHITSRSQAVTARTAAIGALGMPTIYPIHVVAVTTVAGRPGNPLFAEPSAVTGDADGNMYVVDQDHHRIVKLASNGTVLRVYGDGNPHWQDGPAATAGFNTPSGIAISPDGRIYVADLLNHRIRYITPAGDSVKTLAGSVAGLANGTGANARFNMPSGVAVDATGLLYVADYGNNMIRRVTSLGEVTILAGAGHPGYWDDTGTFAVFNGPESITVTADGTAYVADIGNQRIRKIVGGVVTTLAGNGTASSVDGTGTGASFNYPASLVLDAGENVYVADKGGNCIRMITPDRVVTTLAGSQNGVSGWVDSVGSDVRFAAPIGIGMDLQGNILVADRLNQAIRKVNFVRAVATLAGDGTPGYNNGKGIKAEIRLPYSLTMDRNGVLYSMDGDLRVRKITPDGTVSLLAGSGVPGYAEGQGEAASFNSLTSLVTDSAGNVYVADGNNHRIRKITPSGLVSTFAGNGTFGLEDGPVTGAVCGLPSAMAFDAFGNMFFTEFSAGLVRKITPDGQVTTFAHLDSVAGTPSVPYMMDIDASGSLYISCRDQHTVFKVTPSGHVGVYIGGGTGAIFNKPSFSPMGISIDRTSPAGNIYIADGRQVDICSPVVLELRHVGNSSFGLFRDSREETALFWDVYGLAVNPVTGLLYVADRDNDRIRVMNK